MAVAGRAWRRQARKAEPAAPAIVPEIFRALGALSESPRPELQEVASLLGMGPLPERAAHADLFLLQLYPYASVYLGAEGMMGGEAADRIAGFWRALGQTPPPDPDQLALLLGFHARLGELEAGTSSGEAAPPVPSTAASPAAETAERVRWRHVREAFFWEHLMSWLPLFLAKLESLEGEVDEFYRRWGALLREALHEEAAVLRPTTPGAWLPLHLREAPELADPRRDGSAAFVGALLSPVRCGMILTRADLARGARALGLPARPGERRAALETLLEEDAAGALAWLAAEATAWKGRHLLEIHCVAPLTLFWQSRAAAAARLLRALEHDVRSAPGTASFALPTEPST
jgi:TorA maturation chaperone TorD